MNYLINIYLAQHLGNNEKVVGNVIADFIKYSKRVTYNYQVEEGILINSTVWSFMKEHSAFKRSKGRVNPKFTRYSIDIVKIIYNHFLAANWNQFSEETLEDAVKKNYLILLEQYDIVPSKLKKMLPMLVGTNGIGATKTVGGLHNFIVEQSSKGFCVGYLQNTLQDLLVNYSAYKEDFDEFMADFKIFASRMESEKVAVLANAS